MPILRSEGSSGKRIIPLFRQQNEGDGGDGGCAWKKNG